MGRLGLIPSRIRMDLRPDLNLTRGLAALGGKLYYAYQHATPRS